MYPPVSKELAVTGRKNSASSFKLDLSGLNLPSPNVLSKHSLYWASKGAILSTN